MTKKYSTKKALIASVLFLALLLSMLVGTTFAWFTDSVTSTNNKIVSGNLDVELYYQAEGQTDWTKVTENTNVFKENALWEPGHTEVVKLKVVNEGTLALKYQLGVNVASEVGSINVNNEEFKLSDYIKYGIVDGAQTYTRDQAIAAVDATATELNAAYNSVTTALEAKNDGNTDEKIVTMVVYMPTSVGNEANAKPGAAAPTINLGINLFATQQSAENDSFDNTYDENAWHPDFVVTNSDELKVALTKGGNVALANDVIISESLPVTKDTVLDLNGKNIGTSGSTTGSPLYLQGGKLTVKNGTLDLDGSHTNVNGTFSTAIGYDAQTELVVENVNFTGTTAINGTFATDGPLKIAISDCTMDVTNVGIAVSANSTEAIATINNCNIDADVYAIFASQGSKITINGGTYKSAGKVITSMYDNTVVTINGGTFDGELWVTGGGALVIYGGTFTVDPSDYVADGYDVLKKEQANGDEYYTVLKGDVRYPSVAASANGEYRFEGEGANRLDDCYFVVPAGDYTDKAFFSQEFAGGNVFDGENATFADVQVLGNYCTDADDVFTVKNVSSNGKLTVGVSGGTIVIDNCNVKAMRISGASKIIVKNSTINGYGENRNGDNGGYGMYIIPAGNYELSVLNNTINNCDMHCIAVQANGAGAVEVKGNDFKAWGSATNKMERAAFKIWGDTVLAPTNMSSYNDLGNEAKALVADILANNTFPADLTAIGGTGTQVIFDFYDAAFSAAE